VLDRLILGVVLSVVGCNGLFFEPTPPVEKTFKQKAQERQQSEICLRKNNKHQSNAVKRMCKRWREQQNG
jgi:hypothetical protein